MKVLILEDELLVADQLIENVRKLQPTFEIEGPITSVQEARLWFKNHSLPDLILSDIQLSDGISIDLLLEVKPDCPIIFTTAFDQYAVRAFKVNSIDYLLKPIQRKDLQVAFEKFAALQQKYQSPIYLNELASFLKEKTNRVKYKENFIIHQGATAQLIEEKEIAFFVKNELIFLVQIDKRKSVTEYRSLDEVEELVNPVNYFRANRQFLVHRKMIAGYKADYTGKLALSIKIEVGEAITVSKEKAAEFKRWFE